MSTAKMSHRMRSGLLGVLTGAALALLLVAPAAEASGPEWRILSIADTTVAPGGQLEYFVTAYNISGEESSSSEATELKIELPPGLTGVSLKKIGTRGFQTSNCPGGVAGLTSIACSLNIGVGSHHALVTRITVAADPGAVGKLSAQFELSGGGAGAVSTTDSTEVSTAPLPFGFDTFTTGYVAEPEGSAFAQAGGHPFSFNTDVELNRFNDPARTTVFAPTGEPVTPVESVYQAGIDLPLGLIANPAALPHCTAGQLANAFSQLSPASTCPAGSQVGEAHVPLAGGAFVSAPLFNMVPPPGVPARFAISVINTVVVFDARLRSESDYGISVEATVPQATIPSGTRFEIWGIPGDSRHDFARACSGEREPFDGFFPGPSCASGGTGAPFVRLPTSCPPPGGSEHWQAYADSWEHRGGREESGAPDLNDPSWATAAYEGAGEEGCAYVPVHGSLEAKPTALEAEVSSGLNVHVAVPNSGLDNPEGISSSDLKDVKIALPAGLTINPSEAEGLGVCSEAQYESSRLDFHPDGAHGCPSDSKIGTVSVKTPLIEETVPGNVYVAKPYENPFDSLLALYIVLEEPERGVLVKQPVKLTLNEDSGQDRSRGLRHPPGALRKLRLPLPRGCQGAAGDALDLRRL